MNETTESARLVARRSAKTRLAQHRQLVARLTEINSAIAQEERQLRQAEDEHTTACQPLQDLLGALEQELIESAIDRREPDQSLQARRRELLSQLHENNVALERAAAESKFKLAPLLRERRKIEEEMRLKRVDEYALQRVGLADPALLRKKFALGNAIKFATLRCDNAAKKVEAWDAEVRKYRSTDTEYPSGEATLANWKYELGDAGRELASLQQRMSELLEAINNE